MENNQKSNFEQSSTYAEDEINLLEYLLVLAKSWRKIVVVSVMAFVLACGGTLLMPNIYTATARIMPPSEGNVGLASMLGGMGDLAALAGISGGGGSGDLYVGMLRSRSVSDAIIDRFDLMTVYGQDYRVKMHEKLNKLVAVSLGKKDGILTVSVENEDPQLAADITNAYIEELQKLNLQLNLNNAGRQRAFLDERLVVVKVDLKNAEEALRDFQIRNKAIRLEAQASATIEAIGELRGALASKEVELGTLLSYQTEKNPQIRTLREAIVQLKGQIAKLEESSDVKDVDRDIFIKTSQMPELGIQYARLLRDFKVQETLFELLTKQYEMAKIEESKNTSSITVLDQAVASDKNDKPKRRLIVLLTTFVVGLISVFFVLINNYAVQMKEEDLQKWKEIREQLRLRTKRKA